MTPPATHAAEYRNTARLITGLLALLAALVGAIALELQIATDGNAFVSMVLWTLGGFVLGFVALVVASLRLHSWTIAADAVVIEERPRVPFTGPTRHARIPYGSVRSLARVQNVADELLELTSADGRRFRLAPHLLKAGGKIPAHDQAGLAAFAEHLRAAAAAAGHFLPPVTDGIGFWNRTPGLLVLGIALLLSLTLAVTVLWGVFDGAAVRGRSGEAVAIVILLPVGVGWVLLKAWRRRRAR